MSESQTDLTCSKDDDDDDDTPSLDEVDALAEVVLAKTPGK